MMGLLETYPWLHYVLAVYYSDNCKMAKWQKEQSERSSPTAGAQRFYLDTLDQQATSTKFLSRLPQSSGHQILHMDLCLVHTTCATSTLD